MKTFLALLLFPTLALAQSGQNITLTCTPPTTYTDGTPIPATDVLKFNFYGAPQGQPLVLLSGMPVTSCSTTRTNVQVGTLTYAATAVSVNGESAQSATVTKIITAPIPKPNPPTGLAISVQLADNAAYTLGKGASGQIVMLPFSTVLPGTLCDATQFVVTNGVQYNVIPKAFVAPGASVSTVLPFAKCS